MPRITDLALKNLPLPERGHVTYWDRPLGVRVSSTGAKTFIVILQSGRRHKIGRYGDITLAQAREAAIRLKAERTLGRILPVPIRFDVAREEYLSALDVRPNTRLYYERTLNRLKARKLADVTLHDIQAAVGDLGLASRNQALASFRTFFKWCTRPPRSYLQHSPLEGLQIAPGRKRKRVLANAELRKVWEAAASQGYPHGTFVQFLILTGQRRTEIANLRRPWINPEDRTITLPDSITKNGREHTFPYGDLVAGILEGIPRSDRTELLFPCRISDERPLSGWSKLKKDLNDGLPHWTLHDLRRTFRTNQAKIGTPPHIGERLINHISGVSTEIEQVYDLWTYLPEMRAAIEKYERYVLALLRTETATGKVAA